jgi:hypothetical protein
MDAPRELGRRRRPVAKRVLEAIGKRGHAAVSRSTPYAGSANGPGRVLTAVRRISE